MVSRIQRFLPTLFIQINEEHGRRKRKKRRGKFPCLFPFMSLLGFHGS